MEVETYAIVYKDKFMRKSIPEWLEFLANEPVYQHVTGNTIRTRLRNRPVSGFTVRQCFGIDKFDRRYKQRKINPIVDNRNDLEKIRQVAIYLKRGMRV